MNDKKDTNFHRDSEWYDYAETSVCFLTYQQKWFINYVRKILAIIYLIFKTDFFTLTGYFLFIFCYGKFALLLFSGVPVQAKKPSMPYYSNQVLKTLPKSTLLNKNVN